MGNKANKKRILYGVGAIGVILVVLIWVAGVLLVIRERQVTHYPGAELIADHSIFKVLPQPTLRRDTAYRTTDEFPAVYNWYSKGFNLGPEKQAQSSCIHLYETESWFSFARIMSVTICNTPNGRMAFVQRTLALR